ncbi:MAG: sigma-70 family RNA polymerase sigma factor [Streptosporangiales bacterium]|nr:sigma-70 family RNA polymerase sigma factor [Streptosporangiales bacterium]
MSDQVVSDLVKGAAAGDQRAWDQLVERYAGLLWSITRCHGLPDAEADDVHQTTWLRLVERLETLRDPARVGAWLATTARRESLRQLSRRAREVPGIAHDRPEPPGLPAAEERHRSLYAALTALPGRCGRLLRLLAATPPASYVEISAALGMPIGSIGPTRARCLGHLRKSLAPRGATT